MYGKTSFSTSAFNKEKIRYNALSRDDFVGTIIPKNDARSKVKLYFFRCLSRNSLRNTDLSVLLTRVFVDKQRLFFGQPSEDV